VTGVTVVGVRGHLVAAEALCRGHGDPAVAHVGRPRRPLEFMGYGDGSTV
jgi:hypothetical protein